MNLASVFYSRAPGFLATFVEEAVFSPSYLFVYFVKN
jgi:hypothetical protein